MSLRWDTGVALRGEHPLTDDPEVRPPAQILVFDQDRRRARAGERRRLTLSEQFKWFWRKRIVPVGSLLIMLSIVVPYALAERGEAQSAAAGRDRDVGAVLKSGDVFSAKVTSIVDGDGIRLSNGAEVRLGDFNAPEWNQTGGRQAKSALSRIALGQNVECTYCEGARNSRRCTSYDRIIATCRLDGKRLGDLMRAQGIAEGGR